MGVVVMATMPTMVPPPPSTMTSVEMIVSEQARGLGGTRERRARREKGDRAGSEQIPEEGS
jgi:hypothetical protein